MKKNHTLTFFISLVLALTLSFSVYVKAEGEENSVSENEETSASVGNEENTVKYTVSYGKGIYISYNGSEPNNFIKGTPPASQAVEENGSVIVASNTFSFRDYHFGGWRYSYTDKNGESKTKYYSPGDVIENVSKDMKLEATWTKNKESLKVGAYLIYADTNIKTEHYIGEVIALKKAPTAPAENYKFCGWTDNEGSVLYLEGDKYEIKNINTVIKPVWSANGEKINYRKVSVETTAGGTASVSQIFILSGATKEISFAPDEGYELSSITINGKNASVSHTLKVTAEEDDISIKAVFKKIGESTSEENSSEDVSIEGGFNINVSVEGGTVSPSQSFVVMKGESVTLQFSPDENYILPSYITDNEKTISFDSTWNGQYTLENVGESHDIKISFVKINPATLSSSTEQNEGDDSDSGFIIFIVLGIIVIAGILGLITVLKNGTKSKKTQKKKQTNKKGQKSK